MKKSKRQSDIYHDLYQAVACFVEAKGGKVIVVGGVQMADYGESHFEIRVKCTGRAPKYSKVSAP